MMYSDLRTIGALSLALVTGCGKSAEPQPPQSAEPPGQANGAPGAHGAQPYAGAAPVASVQSAALSSRPPPGQMAPLGVLVSDPATLQNILAGALAGGAAKLGGLVGGEQAVLEQGINAQAETQAKGMVPEGQLMTARLSADGHAQTPITLQPGSCYTIVGFGGPGAVDFQINLVTAPPVPPQVLAQSAAGSVTPVIGPNEQCVRNPYPLPLVVKVDMHLLSGQALVSARVFKR
jgi:hypothetical protein